MSDTSQRPAGQHRSVPWWMVVAGAFVAIVIGVGVALVATRDDGTSSGDTQELVLEPLGTAGADPFTTSVATEEVAVLTSVSAPAGSTNAELAVAGSEPGLYGGTQDNTACDTAALVTFLDENPDKAAAWAGALGIAPDGIRDYVAGLTPVLLRTDTRVTNHGFANGVATPRQSVLQAGTAVLVDNFGVPRVRCSCGNPLTEPAPLPGQLSAATDAGQVTLVGQTWQQWNPATVVVVNATVEVNQFIIFDIENETEFTQPVGSDVEPVTDVKVIVAKTGVQVLDDSGAVVYEFGFGTPLADIKAKLTTYLGAPSKETPAPAGTYEYCPSPGSVRWGQLLVLHWQDSYYGWNVAAGDVDFQTGAITQFESTASVATNTGISIGATEAQVMASDPTLTSYPNRLGQAPNYVQQDYYIGEGGLTYSFMPQVAPGVATIGQNDEC